MIQILKTTATATASTTVLIIRNGTQYIGQIDKDVTLRISKFWLECYICSLNGIHFS